MGLFDKLFKRDKPAEPPKPEPEPEREPEPVAIIVLRRGMNLPKPEYVAQVIAPLWPSLPEAVPRIGLSQPSWYKTEEVADQIAAGVVETFAAQLGVEGATSRRRAADGPDGCACMVVELFK